MEHLPFAGIFCYGDEENARTCASAFDDRESKRDMCSVSRSPPFLAQGVQGVENESSDNGGIFHNE